MLKSKKASCIENEILIYRNKEFIKENIKDSSIVKIRNNKNNKIFSERVNKIWDF